MPAQKPSAAGAHPGCLCQKSPTPGAYPGRLYRKAVVRYPEPIPGAHVPQKFIDIRSPSRCLRRSQRHPEPIPDASARSHRRPEPIPGVYIAIGLRQPGLILVSTQNSLEPGAYPRYLYQNPPVPTQGQSPA